MKNNTFRIAIIFDTDNLDDRKGFTNAVIDRIIHLKKYLPQEIECDIICISHYFSNIGRLLKRQKKIEKPTVRIIDGLSIKMKWNKFSVIDYLLNNKMHLPPYFEKNKKKALSDGLENYDLISAHSCFCAGIAHLIFLKHAIPYCVTWHGSEIHTSPFHNKYRFNETKTIIENAAVNFFVSRALLVKSAEITNNGIKELLYNGCNNNFKRFDETCRCILRKQYSITDNTKIVAFIGNLFPIKNAQYLPDIFNQILAGTSQKVYFWIIGDGKLRQTIEDRMETLGISEKVRMFGNMSYNEIPELMNCIDLLVLPSVNEGLPLVAVEALRCGAMVVGSDVGGIPEAIGKDNTVETGDNFIERFANKCISVLDGHWMPFVNKELDWDSTAQKEYAIYASILRNCQK